MTTIEDDEEDDTSRERGNGSQHVALVRDETDEEDLQSFGEGETRRRRSR
jgi:hypothetical protein